MKEGKNRIRMDIEGNDREVKEEKIKLRGKRINRQTGTF
jgi:hypothetical protein